MDFGLKVGMKEEWILLLRMRIPPLPLEVVELRIATPMMVGLMENASLSAVDGFLSEGYATVGTHLDVRHLAATPVGMKVYAQAELLEVDGKALTFKVEAFDEVEKIGEGIHRRYIISLEKFLERTSKKKGTGDKEYPA